MKNLATALDDAYARYTYVMLSSVMASNPGEHFRFILLSDDLREDTKAMFKELAEPQGCEMLFLSIDPTPFAPFQDRGWALPAAFRLQLPELFSDNGPLLYLDGDIIVHNSLTPLYDTDLQGHLLGACQDMTVNPNTTAYYAPMRDERINRILEGGQYFNSGVLLIDMEKWRSCSLEYYLKLLKELGGKVAAPDQDLLNVAHEGDWLPLDEIRYDLFAAIARDHEVTVDEVREQNTILHFAGDKPWQGGHIHYAIEGLWWEYALKTPFAESFLEEYLRTSLTDQTIFQAVKEITEQNERLAEELNGNLDRARELLSKIQP